MVITFSCLEKVCCHRLLNTCAHELNLGYSCQEDKCPLQVAPELLSLYELDHTDLVNLVRGTKPHYSVMNDPLVSKYGNFRANVPGEWYWVHHKLRKASDEDLLKLYRICKNSFK